MNMLGNWSLNIYGTVVFSERDCLERD